MDHRITFLSEAVLSIVFTIDTYAAGAVHGQSNFITNNFLLQPVSQCVWGLFLKQTAIIEAF
jgi:hypothetical protein